MEEGWQRSQSLRIGRVGDLRRIWGLQKQGPSFFFFVCFVLMHAPSLWLCKVSRVCFSVPVSSLPPLSVLCHKPNQIRLFQPHSLRPPGEGPVESVSVSRESDQLKTSASSPHPMLWALLGPGNKDNGQLGAVMASRVVREGSLRREHG